MMIISLSLAVVPMTSNGVAFSPSGNRCGVGFSILMSIPWLDEVRDGVGAGDVRWSLLSCRGGGVNKASAAATEESSSDAALATIFQLTISVSGTAGTEAKQRTSGLPMAYCIAVVADGSPVTVIVSLVSIAFSLDPAESICSFCVVVNAKDNSTAPVNAYV
jgi:hypothetical protein